MITSIAFVTMVALVYVHQQVELVKLSYSIEGKEKKLKEMLDRNERVGYTINDLESPSRLENVLSAQKINVSFPRKGHVVEMPGLALNIRGEERLRATGLEKKSPIFVIMDFFSPRAEAQAKER